jgi:hypothetical protein
MLDYNMFTRNQSLCWQAINTVLRDDLYCVKTAVIKFVIKLCDIVINNSEN